MRAPTIYDGTITKKQAIGTVVYLNFFANGEQWTPVHCYLYKFTVTAKKKKKKKRKKKTIVYSVVVDGKETKMKRDKKTNNKKKKLLMLTIL